MIAASEKGLYHSGQTLLHRLDPRVKVLSSLLLVVLTFAATDWIELFPLIATVVLAVRLTSLYTGSLWRVCWMLRWLLLFTLLMHLLLSSGRTLWGISWLSLDGLLMGSFVCVQMLMAIMVSALLAITTSTETLSGTFGWFVQPLQRLGFKTEEWQKILSLTMDFIPVVQEEIHACSTSEVDNHAEPTLSNETGRWSMWRQKLHGFVLRLANRGDLIAHRIAGAGNSLHCPAELSPLMPLALHDRLFSLTIAMVVFFYWLAG
ncbi:MAG: CbiQ family ECF transporter T component [Desulfuromonadales bacterium]